MVSYPGWQDGVQDGLHDEGRVVASAWAHSGAWLADQLEAQSGRRLLWMPVFLGTGIAWYFAVDREPGWLAVGVVLAAAAALFAMAWRARRATLLMLCGVLALGFCLAKAHVWWLSTPQLAASSGPITLKGWVADIVTTGPKNPKIVVEVDDISDIRMAHWPRYAQIRLFQGERQPMVGDYIAISARLFALPWPVVPGGYDHARFLWFEEIGATGRGKVVSDAADGDRVIPARYAWKRIISRLRTAMARRVAETLPKQTAGLAVALMTGDKSLIPRAQREQMAVAGLAHVLAISGLHMSLVAGGTFWLVRALLALFPALALSWPIKKWAALAAIAMGAGYLQISGAGISTQRAFIMLLIMFIAVLANRPAISLRNLAIAALVILVWTPHAVTTASFQMSFMAVMGLIAAYEAAAARRLDASHDGSAQGPVNRWMRWGARAVLALAFTTIIASVFSGLPAAYHFNRAAPLSLLSNLMALPVIGLVVMPTAVLSSLAMLIGFENWPLQIMHLGLQWVAWVAETVEGLPQADIATGRLGGRAMLLAAYGAMGLCLLRGWLRAIGAVMVAAGLVLSPIAVRPGLLVEHSARNVAVRNAEGRLVPAHPRRARFSVDRWLRQDGDTAGLRDAAARTGWTCAQDVCRAQLDGRKVVFMMREAEVRSAGCEDADILIAQFPLRGRCRQAELRIDRFDVWRNGAYAITRREDGSLRVETTRQARGTRPWALLPVARVEVRTTPISPRASSAASQVDAANGASNAAAQQTRGPGNPAQ